MVGNLWNNNAMQEEIWFRPLVWTDYRLAILFTVLIPLVLLIWATIQQAQAIQRLLIIYWRVASLLMITVYLMIPAWSLSYLTSTLARILIPISLWFWIDVNDEITDAPKSLLKLVFTSWRWAITVYCTLGVIISLPFLSCSFSAGAIETTFCRVWLEPPFLYKQLFHANSTPGFLGFLGAAGLCFYLVHLVYFLIVRLVKQGRSAMEQ